MAIDNPISFLVEKQIPEFIRSDMNNTYANFVAFVKAYYEWMEQENGVTTETRSLLSYADIDKTTDEFIKYFVYKFLPYFPQDLITDRAKLIKTINDFYAKKGSTESLKFLFRAVYNEDIDVFFPKENILRASDGKWRIPKTLRLTIANTPSTFDLSTIKKRLAVGRDSRASCVIESAYRTIDAGTGAEIIEIYISNVKKKFDNGELLDVQYIDENGDQGILLSERIIGSLSNLRINPRKRGLRYKVGDPVVFYGGLTDDPSISTQEARAIVSEVTDGRLQTVFVQSGGGGYGFRITPNTEVDVINAPGDTTGTGAIVRVEEISNEVTFQFNLDSIQEYASLTLNAADYGFPNVAISNSNTTLSNAFSFGTVNVGTISKVTIKSSGTNYTEVPTLDVNSFYDTSNSENFYNSTIVVGNESYRDEWEATRQNFLDLGKIASVQIIRGGSGYSTATDKIYVNRNGGGGYGAVISFSTSGGEITGLTLVSGGEGYNGPKGSLDLIVANSANMYASSAGSGAILRAYRYGEGDDLGATVDDVGRIQKFSLTSRGSGYVTTPNVSLKIKDVAIQSIDTPILPFEEGQFVYQTSALSPTFSGFVDTHSSTTGVLRLYNYNGTLNTSLNLVVSATDTQPQYNVNVYSTVATYGNGLARANAEFFNGVINYDGYYLNTDGFLSADKVLQDSRKYHNFSYVVLTEQSLQEYRNMLLDILHPTGTKLFGKKKVVDIVTTGFGFA